MKTKHTQAPWNLRIAKATNSTFCFIESKKSNLAVARVLIDMSRSREETEANARLLVASPELLDALKMVMDTIEEIGTFSKTEEFAQCKNKALQAIAKAEGN